MARAKPLPEVAPPTCSSCRYWHEIMRAEGDIYGNCHRYPPQVVASEGGDYTTRPVTEAAEPTCGEFAPQLH